MISRVPVGPDGSGKFKPIHPASGRRLDRAGGGTYSRPAFTITNRPCVPITHDRCLALPRFRFLDRRRPCRHARPRQNHCRCLYRRRQRQARRRGDPRHFRHAFAHQRHRAGGYPGIDRHAGHGAATHRGMARGDHRGAGHFHRLVDAVDAARNDPAIAGRAIHPGTGQCARARGDAVPPACA